jgi:hypothetical protein
MTDLGGESGFSQVEKEQREQIEQAWAYAEEPAQRYLQMTQFCPRPYGTPIIGIGVLDSFALELFECSLSAEFAAQFAAAIEYRVMGAEGLVPDGDLLENTYKYISEQGAYLQGELPSLRDLTTKGEVQAVRPYRSRDGKVIDAKDRFRLGFGGVPEAGRRRVIPSVSPSMRRPGKGFRLPPGVSVGWNPKGKVTTLAVSPVLE